MRASEGTSTCPGTGVESIVPADGWGAIQGDGVPAPSDSLNVVFGQLVPWQFDRAGKPNVKRMFRRSSFLVSRLLANMWVIAHTAIPDSYIHARGGRSVERLGCRLRIRNDKRDGSGHEPTSSSSHCVLPVPPREWSLAGDFPDPPNTGSVSTHPLPPAAAAAGFRVPEGFRVNVFAAEPDVRNPVAMAWDTRGRLWVAENYTYSDSTQKFDLRLRDRVLIFEDANADGRADKRTVFTDNVQRLGSVELGLGGVWLLCPPQLLFIPDRDGNDVPDGPAEVVLDGFDVARENYHTFANGLRWGPDGWLYGRCGASSPGEIGTPGTPDAARIPLRGGIWRYHPVRKRFEVLCHGTTNPWGHDWNALGEAFFINTVNGHLWHMIPGAHFARPHTIEPNPRVYEVIDQHADHYHWDNSKDSRLPRFPAASTTTAAAAMLIPA